MFAKLNKIILLLIIVFASLLAIEFGLRLRSPIGEIAGVRALPKLNSPGGKRVLFVADSVFGFLNEPHSASAQVAERLKAQGIEVFEYSAPATTTQRVIGGLQAELEEIRPNIVVVMVGKSDFWGRWVNKKSLSGSRVLRAVLLFLSDLRFRWIKFWIPKSKFGKVDTPVDLAWMYFGTHRFAKAMEEFENQLPASPYDERAMRALYQCYLLTDSLPRGIQYFEDLGKKDRPNSGLAAGFALTLKRIWERKIGEASQKTVDELIEHLKSKGGSRERFRAMLWLKKTEGDFDGFSELLRHQSWDQSEPLRNETIYNLRKIVEMIRRSGARVVLLQYPTDVLEVLRLETMDVAPSPSLWGIREAILELNSNEEIMSSIDSDIEHLTPTGARYVGEKLANWLLLYYFGVH